MDKVKNILITGVAGFIASNVLCYLVKKYPQYNFIGIDKESYCSNIKNFEEILSYDNYEYIKCDILDLDKLDEIFKTKNIHVVMHFAAYTHVDHSFGNSLEFTKNNVLGTHILLEITKKYKDNIYRFIYVSTDEVYGSNENRSCEKSILKPTNPYSGTKAATEMIVWPYYESFNIPIIITRGNNVYGPKQFPEKVIPKFIELLENGQRLTIQGSGQQKRSFLYVDDVSSAFDIILNKGAVGEIYNIGIDEVNNQESEISINQLARKMLEHYNLNPNYIEEIEDRHFNDVRYHMSTEKIKKLGWRQETLFEDGVEKTINWYKQNKNYW